VSLTPVVIREYLREFSKKISKLRCLRETDP
jgi:hypothetical protein